MSRQKQGFLFNKNYVLSDEKGRKLWRKDAFLQPIFFPHCSFLLFLWAQWFINTKLFRCILKPWLVLLIMKWALTGGLALDRVQFYIYILSCAIFLPTSLSSEAKIH